LPSAPPPPLSPLSLHDALPISDGAIGTHKHRSRCAASLIGLGDLTLPLQEYLADAMFTGFGTVGLHVTTTDEGHGQFARVVPLPASHLRQERGAGPAARVGEKK